jgi:hypothetical protein
MIQLTLIAPENNSADSKEHKSWNLRALTAALGDGTDWEYTGQCSEDPSSSGVCTCGHLGLRFLFIIRNVKNGETKIVGSTCINHFQNANPKLVEAIVADCEKLRQAAAERIKEAKALAAETEIAELLEKLRSLLWMLAERLGAATKPFEFKHYNGTSYEMVVGYNQTRRVTRELYFSKYTPVSMAYRLAERAKNPDYQFPLSFKAYKSRSAFKKAIETKIAEINGYLSRPSFE